MAEISFSGRHFQDDMILQSVRWYLAFALSYRDIEEIMQERGFDVVIEQDHRLIKRITKPMLGFKNFHCAQATLAGIELIRMIRKGQMRCQASMSKTHAELFYALAE